MSEPEPTARRKLSVKKVILSLVVVLVLGTGGLVAYLMTDPPAIRIAKKYAYTYKLGTLDSTSLARKFFHWCGFIPPRLRRLSWVEIATHTFDDEALKILCTDSEIDVLAIESDRVTVQGLATCAELPKLTHFAYATDELHEDVLWELSQLNIEALHLTVKMPITVESAKLLKTAKTQALTLTCNEITPEAARELAGCSATILFINSDQLTNEDVGLLLRGKFKDLRLSSSKVNDGVEQYLSATTQVQSLALSSRKISKKAWPRLCEQFSYLTPPHWMYEATTDAE